MPIDFSALLVRLELVEFGLEHLESEFPVFSLTPLGLTGDNDSRGNVAESDRRFHLIDILAALTTRAEGGTLDVRGIDLDRGIHNLRSHIDAGEGGVAALCGVEGRDTDEAVHATLGLEVAVGEFPLHFERH